MLLIAVLVTDPFKT